MDRNLRFWGCYTLRALGIGLGAGLMLLLVAVISAGSGALPSIRTMFPGYIMLGCAFSVFSVSFAAYMTYLPLAIAVGSTRREAMWGFCGFKLLSAVLPALVSLLIWSLLPAGAGAAGLRALPILLLTLLLAADMGSLMGLLYRTFRSLGLILFTLLCAGLGAGSYLLLLSPASVQQSIFAEIAFWASDALLWSIALIWMAAAALDLVLSALFLRRMEVKL